MLEKQKQVMFTSKTGVIRLLERPHDNTFRDTAHKQDCKKTVEPLRVTLEQLVLSSLIILIAADVW